MESIEELKKLTRLTVEQLMPILVRIHAHRMTETQCFIRINEDLATIFVLIEQGHLILKHKEGTTTHDTLTRIRNKNSQENSST